VVILGGLYGDPRMKKAPRWQAGRFWCRAYWLGSCVRSVTQIECVIKDLYNKMSVGNLKFCGDRLVGAWVFLVFSLKFSEKTKCIVPIMNFCARLFMVG
jgi:hypothetical protein